MVNPHSNSFYLLSRWREGGRGKREKWDNSRKESIEMGEGEGREGEEKDRVNRGSLYVDFIGFVIVM